MPQEHSAKEVTARLLEHFASNGTLTADNVERALRAVDQSQLSLTKVLMELGLVPERQLLDAFRDVLGMAEVTPEEFPHEPVLPDLVAERFLMEHRIVLLSADDQNIIVAASDPLDTYAANALRLATDRPIQIKYCATAEIERAQKRLHAAAAPEAAAAAASESARDVSETDLARLRESASEAPVIRFVQSLISQAVEIGASDIHIEPFERHLRIRLRIDGTLKEQRSPPVELASAIISRIKIMSGLNIAERRLPQDGAMKLAVRGKEIDFRVATAPVAHGECAVIRILDKSSVPLNLSALGFDEPHRRDLRKLLERPNGIILVTGPTGSGKTTTLYAALAALNTNDRKILSVEDPVEYKIEGVNQIQVRPEIGLNFAQVLRSALRHDPDVLLVGEIRDGETARIAVQAALTGHLVLSTVHTNSAAAAITRLLDMGVEDYLLTSTIAGILAQRLVRMLCQKCKSPGPLAAEWAQEAGRLGFPGGAQVFRPEGCDQCHGSGFRGRTVISELLKPNERLRRLIIQKAHASDVHAAAVEMGMETLRQNGVRKVLAGITSFEEISRAAQEED